MDDLLINRYQPGGDIYATLLKQYGGATANVIAAAARTGDETQVNAAFVHAKYGADKTTSTVGILLDQSPADWVNNADDYWTEQANQVGENFFLNLLKKPFVLLAVVGLAVLAYLFFTGKFKLKIPALPV